MKNITVVLKHSALENYSGREIRKHRQLNPALFATMQAAHDDHQRSIEQLTGLLSESGISWHVIDRDDVRTTLDRSPLIITLGGDGTFIHASHFITKSLLLGVNSAPLYSIGHYCAHDVLSEKSKRRLLRTLENYFNIGTAAIQTQELLRMQLEVSGRVLNTLILNDLLFAESNPAAMTRYTLSYRKQREDQKSSGVWICTPSGSSAAYASAGGKVFARKEIRFIVRELYNRKGKSTRQGVIKAGESLEIISLMHSGRLYLDGSHNIRPIVLGDHIIIRAHNEMLRVVG